MRPPPTDDLARRCWLMFAAIFCLFIFWLFVCVIRCVRVFNYFDFVSSSRLSAFFSVSLTNREPFHTRDIWQSVLSEDHNNNNKNKTKSGLCSVYINCLVFPCDCLCSDFTVDPTGLPCIYLWTRITVAGMSLHPITFPVVFVWRLFNRSISKVWPFLSIYSDVVCCVFLDPKYD